MKAGEPRLFPLGGKLETDVPRNLFSTLDSMFSGVIFLLCKAHAHTNSNTRLELRVRECYGTLRR
jgi:hypothetical protein